ncbi:MAG: Trehalose utilization [Pedosphaera sp.]|nr:Trehalose utilization [Pedosphaera sp.]
MKRRFICTLVLLASLITAFAQSPPPLRVFIRAGVKTHGPDQHDHPRFLKEWQTLLDERGAKASGAMDFPTAEQLDATDVLVLFAAEAGTVSPEQRANLDKFLKRGGGIVAIHDAVCGTDAPWFKTIIGGAWEHGHSKWFEGDISFYYQDHTSPITKGVSNFDFDDEMYYDLHMMPEAKVLAATYKPDDRNKRDGRAMPSVYEIIPQMWTYEKENYRAFVSIPGHNYKSFNLPHYRAILLRGIAWAGKRDVDSLVTKEEVASLLYPEGGPTAPEKAAAKITVPPDFNLSLVAAEPLIEKPISIDWDAQGRLWVAETPEYPFRQDRARAPYDRISILEDSNHDGRMDKKTVFYDGLDLVTSMVFYKDGVIVAQPPDIYWLRDTKHTGKADKKEVLYKGFGTRDTHAVLSNLRWGMDGWIYATVGYSGGDVYSGDEQKHFGSISSGVIRFKPDGSAMEQFSSKSGNTWGVDIAPDGEVFFTQANGSHIDHVVMPESVLARGRVGNATSYLLIEDHKRSFPTMEWKKQAYVQIDWVGNFTAAAGCCIYDGGAWPEKYNYTHYVAEPTINLVHQDILTPNGVTYVASKDPERLEKEFIASTDLWFRPIHMRVGPDGAMYVVDFYNQAAVHNDTRGPKHDPQSNAAIRPDRDHYFGRIWRVQHEDVKKFKVPNLAKASAGELVKALEHPNEWVRGTAQRLLDERGKVDVASRLEKLAKSEKTFAPARIHALWTLNNLGLMGQSKEEAVLVAAMNSSDPGVRKNGLKLAAAATASTKLQQTVIKHLKDTNPRARLEAIVALNNFKLDSQGIEALTVAYPDLKDPWLESAVIGVAAKEPQRFIEVALNSAEPAKYRELVAQLSRQVGSKQDGTAAASLIILTASKPARADLLKQVVLENLVHELKPEVVPTWSPGLAMAFKTLLASSDTELTTVSLPLLARWDKTGSMAGDLKGLVVKLSEQLNDAGRSDDERMQTVNTLLGVRQMNAEIVPSVAHILGSSSSSVLQRRIIEALGNVPEAGIGEALVGAYPKLSADLQETALNQLLKRADWSLALLNAIQGSKINLATLGPVTINRLRTHSDKAVSERANKLIDELRGPEMKEKNALIAKFTPLVTQRGNVVRGKQLFTQNCAICHRFNGEGKDIAPDLTGMGAHGAAELIIHVLDPNRVVEPNFYSYSIETKDGEIYDGIIARENKAGLTLRNAAGDVEIKAENIKSRRNTGLSLMPNGLEALGGDGLRDILSYICAGESNYRVIDLTAAFTANTRRGIFTSQDATAETLDFKRFGLIKAGEVPFEILNPLKSTSGNNVIVLKGGNGFAKTLPQRVQIENINIKAGKLHFLGGVGGWAYPWDGGNKNENVPVAKVTVLYADNEKEQFILKNGNEFADYIGNAEVPGSKAVADLVTRGQVRSFSKTLKHQGVISSIILESFDNRVAPVFVGITAETGTAGDTTSSVPTFKWGQGKRVLIVGGGSSHDFSRWFNHSDVSTLTKGGEASVNYTENVEAVLPALNDLDVLYISNNQPMPDPQLRKGIFDFADAGHGLLLVHPALWYNWKDWPEYNRILVGGGANSHDKYDVFEVTVKDEKHPLVAGVPKTFKIADELYHTQFDTNGTPVEVLAEGKNLTTGKTYPVLWITKYSKARIVCCTLGHDGQAHELTVYKTILRNSVNWVAQ